MSAVRIGPYTLQNGLILAPMAGVTDQPFRQLCKRLGAGLVVSEMVTSDMSLWNTRKSRLRMIHEGDPEPRSVQIAGGDPQMMADAARHNVANGAQIIDINMGCPAKKICNVAAGSALLKDEPLVARILEAVVRAVGVPVTLKIRTGWDRENRNGIRVAELAQDAGIQALAVHGRTRADLYKGEAEYDTIAAVKAGAGFALGTDLDAERPGHCPVLVRAHDSGPWYRYELSTADPRRKHLLEQIGLTFPYTNKPKPADIASVKRNM